MYILTDGKNYVMDDPIHPGRVMYSTSPVNAKKFTFKQARALLNNKSKKLSWIRSFNMVDDSSGEKIAEQEVRSRSNKGIFVGKNDIDFDVSILDQIMQETNNLLGIAGWNMAQLTTYQNMLSRDELKSVIESYGGKVSGSVSAKTFALINNDIESSSNLIDYFVLNDGDIEESIKKMENVIKKDKSKRGSTDEN